MKFGFLKTSLIVSIVAVSTAVGVTLVRRSGDEEERSGRGSREARAVPVEVKEISRGEMEQRRRFSGTLTPSSQLSVAPKISGRIASIHYDISDPVERGAVVATLDDAEFTQALSSARADLRVAEAQASEAANRLELAERELARVRTLEERGVASAAALDNAQTEYLMRQSAHHVAEANLDTRRAAVSTAEIRLSYTQITATWSEGDESRVVAERFKDDGDTVAANTPLLSVVRLRPIRAVFFVPERDYGRFERGQTVEIRTDAFPGVIFPGRVSRVSPVFQEDSRQARVEVLSDNEDERLKPGMFIRAEVVFQTLDDAIAVPQEAITRRGGETGVFVVNEDGETVSWKKVETGVESGGMVQILEPEIEGRVVTLGQQLLGDGSTIRIIDDEMIDDEGEES
ncbi:MAG: efflux RND transporter periplasmic adaptor subunit [Verrucomicrobia bacterium]|nr:efflux RND transporter periplasmic adaptor subunit [Verrucomicrobiota bacterium]MCH8513781.1 efflux RND transporter periplasmic adaptor subunit [Kiritimatiellia bacterium]